MSEIPFTCPACHVAENEVEVVVSPFHYREDDPGAGRRCPSCYARYRVWRDAARGIRALRALVLVEGGD